MYIYMFSTKILKNKIPVCGVEGNAFKLRWTPNHHMEHCPFGFIGQLPCGDYAIYPHR